jgi:hypothetical protein
VLRDPPWCRCPDCLLDEVKHGPVEPDRRITLRRAEMIAGKLGHTTKMPGYTYGLDSHECKRGQKLMVEEGSVCSGCYTLGGFYQFSTSAKSRSYRQKAIHDPRWVDAMVRMIRLRCVGPEKSWFRWHDSGDLAAVWHLRNIVSVAYRTETVHHWLPTREHLMVADYLALVDDDAADRFPENLVVRLSADYLDEWPEFEGRLAALTTSSVHRFTGHPVRGDKANESIECLAPSREHRCGSCRACWSPNVRNVSYVFHD